MRRFARWFDLVLQAVTLTLLIALAIVVLMGIAFRYSGNSLIWYDEVAAVLLAWITFTGAALAMHRNAHMGFNGLLYALPNPARMILFWLVELIVLGCLCIVAWAGWAILEIFGNETMTTLRFVPRTAVQGILPVSAVAMILARLLILPQRLGDVRSGMDPETKEIEEEIARAQADVARAKTETTS